MSGKYQISYTPEAYSDLADIYSYIAFALQEKRIAASQIKRIQKEISSLRTFPERYSAVDWEPWASIGMRRLPVDHYIVYYQVSKVDKAVTVIRIFYGGRDVEHVISEERECGGPGNDSGS